MFASIHGTAAQAGRLCVISMLAAALTGCDAGSGDGLAVSGRPVDEAGDVPLAATLESIQVNVFDAACTICHAGAAAPLGLRLDAENSYTNLVGVPSRQNGALLRVQPGDPDSSYLVRKIEGTASVGGRMPLGGPALSASTVAFVRQWIADGAPDGDSADASGALAIISMDPAPGTRISRLPEQIVVGTNRDIDASTFNEMTFLLERAGGDGVFGDAADVAIAPAAIGVSAVNARVAIVSLAGIEPVGDVYRVRLSGSGPSTVLGVGGQALDGEYSGPLPSGDGVEGGDFVATFTLEVGRPVGDGAAR